MAKRCEMCKEILPKKYYRIAGGIEVCKKCAENAGRLGYMIFEVSHD